MVHSHWMSPGQGLGHGLMGCMVLCRTFHTTPEQGQRPEQGRMVYRPIFQALKRSGTRQCDYIIRAHLHQVSASTCGNSAMVLAILFSLKSMETLENGLQPHHRRFVAAFTLTLGVNMPLGTLILRLQEN